MIASKYPGLETQPDQGRAGGPLIRMLRPLLRAQFGQPSGLFGEIAGRLMARDKSNVERTRWTLALLEIAPGDRVMEIGNVKSITMTNEAFTDNERTRWMKDAAGLADPRFRAVLRIDPILRDWPGAAAKLSSWGYSGASEELNAASVEAGRKFLRDWIDRMKAIYLAVSLPPAWRYPANSAMQRTGVNRRSSIVWS